MSAPVPVRVRFCPSPTGNPHVGMLRTALFNWAHARHTGGTFVFRIEDTDAARDSEQSYEQLLDALRWLGLDWDEGPEVGGKYGPYRQSERGPIYADVAEKLLAAGYAYRCYCTAEELEAQRERDRAAGRPPGYVGTCRDLTAEQRAAYEAEGRESVVRMRMPAGELRWNDLVRGEVSFDSEYVPDYVIVRANGQPLYTLVNPVDDALMRITTVLRGEDLLSSTPRQLVMHQALVDLGISEGVPEFGHLPYVMGEGNKKLSKRDPESSLSTYRDGGYLPEALANYLALLGWSIGGDREFFTLDEMADAFEVSRVNPNPARFDLKKCTALNADWIRSLSTDDLATRLEPYLLDSGLAGDELSDTDREVLRSAVPLIAERMNVLTEGPPMLGFLFAGSPGAPEFAVDPDSAAQVESAEAQETIAAGLAALEEIGAEGWTTPAIESALRKALLETMQLKPRAAFTPLRVAVTGRRVSPPLFESMELLGRERTLERLRGALAGVQ